MLTLQDVEHGIRHFGTVELGGELSFPLRMSYDQAAARLQSIASQTGAIVKCEETLAGPALRVYPHGEQGYWWLVWRDGEIEIDRFYPETKRFSYNRPAAAGA